MNKKFNDIPMDKDTKILFSSPMKWGDLDIVYQKWNWEGIMAESIIFLNEDLKVLRIAKNVPFHPGRSEDPPVPRTFTALAQHILEIKSL